MNLFLTRKTAQNDQKLTKHSESIGRKILSGTGLKQNAFFQGNLPFTVTKWTSPLFKVAQWLRSWAYKPEVPGSKPAG